jgi:hypothetical protein
LEASRKNESIKNTIKSIINEVLKEKDSAADKKKLIDYMVKHGNNAANAREIVNARYDYMKQVYPDATMAETANIMLSLGKNDY